MKNLFVLALLVVATGCSMEASLESIGDTLTSFQDPAKTTGLVSGSSQSGIGKDAITGVAQYYVQSTVGNYMSGIDQKTTDGSYHVYSSVQGAIVSPQ